ncbi:MAG TPA: MFS transporter [Gemmataceae bacterium]|jgi:predicted MFS family arabinose efflux permease
MGDDRPTRWYSGITRYQWLVLAIASLGWVFDVFEGQIFVAGQTKVLTELLPPGTAEGDIMSYGNLIHGFFLAGGAIGGVLFGVLSDRIGRVRTMVLTILVYSVFTGLSSLTQAWWQFAACRFLVALGTGGEWAVASAFVAEVFPVRARAWSLAIFHASSVLGTYLAIVAGEFVIGNPALGWRWAFVIGAIPALLTLWARTGLHESDAWRQAQAADTAGDRPGVGGLFQGVLARRTLLGVALATVGLATFWGMYIYGKDMLSRAVEAVANPDTAAPDLHSWSMLGMLLVTTGGFLGSVSFGPMSEWLGRRGAFLVFHLGGVIAALLLFKVLSGVATVAVFLPVFGFWTLGMHAGYAIYFPELYPTRLRSTGAGFCFNVGRLTAFPIVSLIGWVQRPATFNLSLPNAAALLSLLFLVGAALLVFAPETKGKELAA